jgi:outer membrane protein assembly factor BamB
MYLTATSVVALAALVSIYLAGLVSGSWSGRQTFIIGGRALLLAGLAVFSLLVCLFGEQLFGLRGSILRSWKIGSLAATMSLCITLLLSGRSRAISLLVGLAGTLLSICAYLFIPKRELFLDLHSSGGIIATAVVLLPAVVAWGMSAAISSSWLKRVQGPDFASRAPLGLLAGRLILLCGIPALAVGVLAWVLMRRTLRSGSSQALLIPSPGWFFTAVAAGACASAIIAGVVWVLRGGGELRSLKVCGSCLSLLVGAGCFAWFACLPGQRQLAHAVVCVDRSSGSIRWLREVAFSALTDLKEINSRATPTVVATTNRVCAYFGAAGLFGLDYDGKMKWKVLDTVFESEFGVGHSPTCAEGVVVLANDSDLPRTGRAPKAQIAAYDTLDGRLLWRSDRFRSEPGSAAFATPIIRNIAGEPCVLVRGWEDLTAYELHTGKVRWSRPLKYRGDHLVASVVADEKRLYLMDTARIMAISLESLEAGRDEFAWQVPVAGEKVSSPVLIDGQLFGVTESGLAFSIDVEKGSLEWKQKLKGRFFGSALAAGDQVLFASESGQLYFVVRAPKCAVTVEKSLGENVYATPAPQREALLVRGVDHLFCLASGGTAGSQPLAGR